MSRLYTFGCSFTNYVWPTWATLLLTVKNGENWALPGMGNKFIFESLVECNVTHKLTKDDIVIIMWSSWFREDRFIADKWLEGGNVYNHHFYDKSFIEKYYDEKGAVLHNLNFMSAAIMLLESIGCKYIVSSAFPLFQLNENMDGLDLTMLDDIVDVKIFKKYIDFITQNMNIIHEPFLQDKYHSHNIIYKNRPWNKKPGPDWHPTPDKHFLYLKDHILPKLNFTKEEILNLECNVTKIINDFYENLEKTDYEHPKSGKFISPLKILLNSYNNSRIGPGKYEDR